jgi:hypothetical protein
MKKYILVPHTEFNETAMPKGINVVSETKDQKLDVENIISSIPKKFAYKARVILNHIIHNTNKITWNDKGEVIINEKLIPNSHIVDLIKCSLYTYKNCNPRGLKEFIHQLKDSNIPETIIQSGSGNVIPPPGIPVLAKPKKTSSLKWTWHKM